MKPASAAVLPLALIAILLALANPSAAESGTPPAELDPLRKPVDDARAKLAEAHERRIEIIDALGSATGQRRLIFEEQLWQLLIESQQGLTSVADNLLAQQRAGHDVSEAVSRLADWARGLWPDFEAELRAREATIYELLDEELSADGDSSVESRIRGCKSSAYFGPRTVLAKRRLGYSS
jgi:hypothetical protein